MPSFILINFIWHFPDKLSMHFLFTPVLFKFLCFLLLKFSTHCSIFSIDCLRCSNSPDEVFFRIDNKKTQTIFLFFNATFHTYQTSASLFPLYVQSVHIAAYIVLVFLVFLSPSFNSLSFHCSIPAPYLNTDSIHAFIVVMLFFPFSFDFRTNR